jgi:hypothetical protein
MLQQPRKYTEIANLLIVSYYIYHGQIISESETSKIENNFRLSSNPAHDEVYSIQHYVI